jgi:hypothetical protein
LALLLLVGGGLAALLLLFRPTTRTTAEPTNPTLGALAVTAVATSLPSSPAAVETAAIIVPAASPSVAATGEAPVVAATVTPLGTIIGVVITPTFGFGPGANMLQNGDFHDDWVNGWISETSGPPGLIEARLLEDEPDTRALHLEKTGAGLLQLAQRAVPTYPVENLLFSGRVQAMGTSTTGVEGRGGLMLRYEDASGHPLGASIWLDGSSDATALWGIAPLPPVDSPAVTRFLDSGWQTLTLDLGRELAEELPGVDPVAVRQITVFLFLLGGDACDAAGCAASLDATDLSLTANLP